MYVNPGPRPRLLLAAVATAQLVAALDVSVVNVALPAIRVDLGFGSASLSWVVDVYALMLGGFLLLGGRLADLFGRRRLFVGGLGLFGLASLAGGLARAPVDLVAARAVQGLGAAVMIPAALALLTTAFPVGAARTRALGVWGIVAGVGGALGVVVGGLLTEYAGWRWVMFVNLPPVVLGIVLVALAVPPDGAVARRGRLDLLGAILATAGLGLLVLGVVRSHEIGWGSSVTLATLGVGGALLVAFVCVERRVADPLFRLGLLAGRPVAVANVFLFLLFGGQFAAFYFVSLYLQNVLRLGAAGTGVAFLPFSAGLVLGTVLAGRAVARSSLRTVLVGGGLLAAVGFGWFGLLRPDGGFLGDVLGPSLVTSVGLGLCLPLLAGAATAGVAAQKAGMASGLINSSRQVGGCLGLAVLTTLAAARTGARSDPAALTDGYALGLTIAAFLLAGAAVVAWVVLPRARRRGPGGEPAHPLTRREPGKDDMSLTTHDLYTTGVRLHDGAVRAEERRMTGDDEGWLLGAFRLERSEDVHPDHWEIHPAADEAVCVLRGGVRLYLRPPVRGETEDVTEVPAGQFVVVPRGRWHRLELDEPTELMSITVRRGARLERRCADEGGAASGDALSESGSCAALDNAERTPESQ